LDVTHGFGDLHGNGPTYAEVKFVVSQTGYFAY